MPKALTPKEQAQMVSIVQVTAEEVFNQKFNHLQKDIESADKIQRAIIVVVVVGFVTLLFMVAQMFNDSNQWKAEMYRTVLEQLKNK